VGPEKDVFIRIDDRLIHGQVVEAWFPLLKPQAVVVVSDTVASDPVQTSLLSIALPEGVELFVEKTTHASRRVLELAGAGRRVFVLTPSPHEALALLEGGVEVRSVNVGGLHYAAGKVQLGKAIFLSREDREALMRIAAKGVGLEGRALPQERPRNLLELVK